MENNPPGEPITSNLTILGASKSIKIWTAVINDIAGTCLKLGLASGFLIFLFYCCVISAFPHLNVESFSSTFVALFSAGVVISLVVPATLLFPALPIRLCGSMKLGEKWPLLGMTGALMFFQAIQLVILWRVSNILWMLIFLSLIAICAFFLLGKAFRRWIIKRSLSLDEKLSGAFALFLFVVYEVIAVVGTYVTALHKTHVQAHDLILPFIVIAVSDSLCLAVAFSRNWKQVTASALAAYLLCTLAAGKWIVLTAFSLTGIGNIGHTTILVKKDVLPLIENTVLMDSVADRKAEILCLRDVVVLLSVGDDFLVTDSDHRPAVIERQKKKDSNVPLEVLYVSIPKSLVIAYRREVNQEDQQTPAEHKNSP